MVLDKRPPSAFSIWPGRLPTEVLCYIFDYCLPDTKYLSPTPDMAPILLTRVCRRWREVAVDMPSLWCRLSLKVFLKDWQRNAFCYDTWLKRSRGLPLSLALQWQGHVSTELQNLLQPYLKQVLSLSILSLENAEKPALVLRNLSELQQLTIRIVGPLEPALTQFFPCMPFTLRSLEVTGPLFDLTRLDTLNHVLPHLTNIRINIYNSITCLRLFQLAPNLSSLSIGILFFETQALTPFTHTKLQFLRIVDVIGSTDQLPDLFNALSFPNLRVLEARSVPKWPHEELKAFLARSKFPLERLVL
ncbi:hypothetical protein DFJ58DRAFT_684145, partial [Suillus subalutaceus]|uniref:uncharacterized protein n=1 Tax=Suillus subalutaceus TaxID=48586 RepID=UPI001B86E9CF